MSKLREQIDKWCAEQSDVEVSHNGMCRIDYADGESELVYWTIQDPRCREIVRERFRLKTEWIAMTEVWSCCQRDKFTIYFHGQGKTIAEAEIACVTAICEASDE